jgi:hypothetical protein
VLGLPTEARAGQPIAGTQLGECDGGNDHCNAAKFYDEPDDGNPGIDMEMRRFISDSWLIAAPLIILARFLSVLTEIVKSILVLKRVNSNSSFGAAMSV